MLEAMMMTKSKAGSGLATEIPASDLINAADLKTLIGLTTGVITINDTTWLEVPYKDTLYYVAKTPLYTGVSWNTLNGLGVTTGITKTIKGKQYTVRSLQGVLTNNKQHPSNIPANAELTGTEWNEIMNVYLFNTLKYTNAQLGFASGYGVEWAREAGSWYNSFDQITRQCGVVRGGSSTIAANLREKQLASAWRPILVLVE